MTCVARGCGLVLDDLEAYEQLLIGIERNPYSSFSEIRAQKRTSSAFW